MRVILPHEPGPRRTDPAWREAWREAQRFERSLDPQERAAHGVFFTPPEVADRMAEAALSEWRARRPPGVDTVRVLDPSCGAGALLAAVRRIAPEVVPGVRLELVGTDRDARALAIAARAVPGATLARGDALAHEGPTADVVLTNPPYGPAAPPDINRYVTFWRAAARRVRPGGVLVVLAPTSWRTGSRYTDARRAILEETGLQRVVELASRPFADAYVDTCIAVCLPGARAWDAVEPRTATRLARALEEQNALHALNRLFDVARGILAKRTVGSATDAGKGGVRLLVGRVAPFGWPDGRDAFAWVRPDDVVEGKGSLELLGERRLLVRRIIGRTWRLTAVVPQLPAAVKKDFYVLVPRDPSLNVEAYAALLHAAPTSRVIAAAESAAVKGDFAQLTVVALRALRVPRLPTQSAADIARASHLDDAEVDVSDRPLTSAWLTAQARKGRRLGNALLREGVREVDADPRWAALRDPLDRLAQRLLG